MKKAYILGAGALTVCVLIYLISPNENHNNEFDEESFSKETQQLELGGLNTRVSSAKLDGENKATGAKNPQEKSKEKEENSNLPKDFFAKPEKEFIHKSGEFGIELKEGGGGPVGAMLSKDGEPIIFDAFGGRIAKINSDGKVEELMKVPKGEIIKGFSQGPNGELGLLTGGDRMSLTVLQADGTEKQFHFPGRLEAMDSMRMEWDEEGLRAYGVDKSYDLILNDKEPVATPYYGYDLFDGDKRITQDTIRSKDGTLSHTLRNEYGDPVDQKPAGKIKVGALHGDFRLNNGAVATVVESDPFVSDFNMKNPHFMVVVKDRNGHIDKTVRLPYAKEAIDGEQKVVLNSDGKLLHSYCTYEKVCKNKVYNISELKDQTKDVIARQGSGK